MKLKTLVFLILICTGLGLYIHFAIEKPNEKKFETESSDSKLIKGDLSQLQTIRVESGEKKIGLEKINSKWWITSPLKDIAAQNKMDTLTAALGRLKQSKVILKKEELAAKKEALKQYGLDPAKLIFEYKTSDIAAPASIFSGLANPSSNGVYAQLGKDGEVVLTTMDIDYLTTQGVDDFREMRLITVDPNDYAEVEIQRKDKGVLKKIKLKKNEKQQWIMTAPYSLPVDEDFARSELQKISYIRANSFLPTLPDSLKDPEIRIVVGFKENVQDLRANEADTRPHGTEILLSRIPRKGMPDQFDYFGKSDKTAAANIAQFHYDNFSKSPEDFVRKSFNLFDISDIKKLIIKQSGSSEIVITRNKEDDYGVEQGEKKKKGIAQNINAAIKQIQNLRAAKFIEVFSKPTSTPSLSVQIEKIDGRVLHFVFDFKKEMSELWFSNVDQKLRYVLGKDPITLSYFDFDALTNLPTKKESQLQPPKKAEP
ncbi:MAG: DUF4340 domain-containing protein [Deltaproteobacteria bacterium]|nr:DUF4340 domain-containing protein [Deltaproteobacteria bacterium]